jgi:threonylcarbamoyladenosine tRNA methylthiotransferase MtaB
MRVYLDTVGCRLNQAEIEGMAGEFRAAGHEIVAAPEQADLAVVNTCSVTGSAAADSRALIRRLARKGRGRIVATGCWATLRQSEARAMPGVLAIFPNRHKETLVADVLGFKEKAAIVDVRPRQPIPGARHRTRAFIKVQDGCDNHCTFCVTTIARGAGRSRGWLEVVADVRAAVQGGAKEIVLTGVQLGSWGADLGLHLGELLRAILRETEAPRVALSSLEPWNLEPEFFRLWEDTRLCRHFHLPLQSGCAATLRRMRRRTTPDAYRALVEAALGLLPDAAITTDVIAGFPGETEDEFRASLEFVRGMELAGGHAFTYSPMAGTAAARMERQVPVEVRRRRTRCFTALFEAAGHEFRTKHLGTRRGVLWESATGMDCGGWEMDGLTDNYIRVDAWAAESRWNRIDPVLLQETAHDRIHGVIVE